MNSKIVLFCVGLALAVTLGIGFTMTLVSVTPTVQAGEKP
jgi:hypothetical protein